ncbi:MAG: histidine kinase dimerization/phospho-acceptor domain-containing protein, partial [Pseudomonadota bacterium]
MQQIEDLIGHPETRLGEMIEASPSCLKIVDRSGRLLTMNSKGLSMIEADSMEEVAGADVFALVAPDSREAFIKFHEEVCGGQTKRLIFNLVGLKGTQRTMDTWAAPYRLNNGEVAHLAITNDITEQQQTAAELETQRHALELSARRAALGELAAGIAHEINNPLGIIAGIAGLARAQLAIDKVDKEELSKRLGEIEDTVARISDITGALRTFSRDVPGDQREAYCLRSAVDETFGLVAERCRVHG